MAGWRWLTTPKQHDTYGFIGRVLLKAGVLFVILNVAAALLPLVPMLERVTVYNWLVPGRQRLPYGEDSAAAYNLSLNALDAMFASHTLASAPEADTFRVLLIGDSSVWGILLHPDETLAGSLNARQLVLADGRTVRAYNLGYPIMSLTKDLLILDRAMQHDPDLIIWLVTLESFALDHQLAPPLVGHNAAAVRRLIDRYALPIDPDDTRLRSPDIFERTLVGQRRPLADWLRLQLYGFTWAATGIDQAYPDQFTPRRSDFEPDVTWHNFDTPQTLTRADLAFDVLAAGVERAGDTPVLLVNEPMFISSGQNSDLRYNFFYPRWVYDDYRRLLAEVAAAEGWGWLDLWDAVPPDEFTDSPVHLTPDGSRQLADSLAAWITATAD